MAFHLATVVLVSVVVVYGSMLCHTKPVFQPETKMEIPHRALDKVAENVNGVQPLRNAKRLCEQHLQAPAFVLFLFVQLHSFKAFKDIHGQVTLAIALKRRGAVTGHGSARVGRKGAQQETGRERERREGDVRCEREKREERQAERETRRGR